MIKRGTLSAAAAAALLVGCSGPSWGPLPSSPLERGDGASVFQSLFARNCAACHGREGRGGAALSLRNPAYLAMADDGAIRKAISQGVPGTPMPAFATSAGGDLSDEQISILVLGIRSWADPGALAGARTPPYAASNPGSVRRGADVFSAACASCHGLGGQGGARAGSVVDPSFLALISDQGLRVAVIAGRPELGAPDWRGDRPGRPLSNREVTDVVAWLQSRRVRYPGAPYPRPASRGFHDENNKEGVKR